MEVLSLYGITLLFVICMVGIHGPWFDLNKNDKRLIKVEDVLHFTSIEKAGLIKKEGLKGKCSDMGYMEKRFGNLIWFYSFRDDDDIDKAHNILLSKKRGRENPNNFQVCLRIYPISEEEQKHLSKCVGFGGMQPIVCKGDYIKSENIELLKIW